jgi:hypothetical protein
MHKMPLWFIYITPSIYEECMAIHADGRLETRSHIPSIYHCVNVGYKISINISRVRACTKNAGNNEKHSLTNDG